MNLLLQNHLDRLYHLNVIILNSTYWLLRYNLSTIFNIVNLYLYWRGIRLDDITWMDTNLSCVALSINFSSDSRGVSYYEVINIVFCNNVSYMLCWCRLTLLLLKLLCPPSLPFRLILLIIIVLLLISLVWPKNCVISFLIFIENFIRCHDIFNFYLIISWDHISIFILFLFLLWLQTILGLQVINKTLVIEVDHPLFLSWLAALLTCPSVLLLSRLEFLTLILILIIKGISLSNFLFCLWFLRTFLGKSRSSFRSF